MSKYLGIQVHSKVKDEIIEIILNNWHTDVKVEFNLIYKDGESNNEQNTNENSML